jgi:hypothetical protein
MFWWTPSQLMWTRCSHRHHTVVVPLIHVLYLNNQDIFERNTVFVCHSFFAAPCPIPGPPHDWFADPRSGSPLPFLPLQILLPSNTRAATQECGLFHYCRVHWWWCSRYPPIRPWRTDQRSMSQTQYSWWENHCRQFQTNSPFCSMLGWSPGWRPRR